MKKLVHSKAHGSHYILYDKKDHALVSKYKWSLIKGPNRNTLYALIKKTNNKKKIFISMHRLIMGLPKSKIDHKNGNGLDNRNRNLRLATDSQNKMNTKIYRNNTSGYKGVSYCKRERKFQAYISFDNKTHGLGLFEKAIDGAKAYNRAAKKHHGKFALLNKI